MTDDRNEKAINETDLIARFDEVLAQCEQGQTWIIERDRQPVAVLLTYMRYSQLLGENQKRK